ncbi:cell division protein ZapA [Porticoccaceae bacterium]|jgi:cell division protein ZapA|nr:cell division protein ZapA [Porticoccaceae bacterium]MDA8651892.1 cell division protein ZapA [Porticoccaceae bacterium]MDA8663571.1 cell division protein ZapA [Porticoccaceae bacterium]MDA8681910.1 cell division protein ZapA [Porticoccaceae bacterium]MDB2634243.1 cell division protein ZapA [Porticoccaceae bacterium]
MSISLKIRILDKEYQVNCAPDEREALEYSAKLLNEKMEEIRHGSHIIGLERIAVMAALNLAHDLIRTENNAKQNDHASGLLSSMDAKLNSVLADLSN